MFPRSVTAGIAVTWLPKPLSWAMSTFIWLILAYWFPPKSRMKFGRWLLIVTSLSCVAWLIVKFQPRHVLTTNLEDSHDTTSHTVRNRRSFVSFLATRWKPTQRINQGFNAVQIARETQQLYEQEQLRPLRNNWTSRFARHLSKRELQKVIKAAVKACDCATPAQDPEYWISCVRGCLRSLRR